MNTSKLPVRSVSRVLRAGMLAAGIATLGNVIIYLVSSGPLNLSFTVQTPTAPFTVTIANVITETLLMAAGATLLSALLSLRSAYGKQIFWIMAVIVLLVSLIFPLILPVEPPMKIALALMHIFSAVVIVTLLTGSYASA